MSLNEIMRSLPERVEPHLFFADYLKRTGNEERAGAVHLTAPGDIRNEPAAKPHYFLEIYRFVEQKGLNSEALKVLQKVVECFPDNLTIRLFTARAYEKVIMPHRRNQRI